MARASFIANFLLCNLIITMTNVISYGIPSVIISTNLRDVISRMRGQSVGHGSEPKVRLGGLAIQALPRASEGQVDRKPSGHHRGLV